MQAKLPPVTQEVTMAHLFDGFGADVKAGSVSTFGQLAAKCYDVIMAPSDKNGFVQVDVAFDQYRARSLKARERAQ